MLTAGFLGGIFGPVDLYPNSSPNATTGSPIQDAVLGVNQPCIFCGGTGRCHSCNGTGKEVRRNYDYDIDDSSMVNVVIVTELAGHKFMKRLKRQSMQRKSTG